MSRLDDAGIRVAPRPPDERDTFGRSQIDDRVGTSGRDITCNLRVTGWRRRDDADGYRDR
jgi:hypothetical protein